MHTSDEKVRISDEVEHVQSVSYPHIRSLSVMLLSLMPIAEPGETRVKTDGLNFDVSHACKLKNKFQFKEEGAEIIFFAGF